MRILPGGIDMSEGNAVLPFLKNGVAQVGFVVKDLDAAVENWVKVFGVGPWHFYTYGKPLVRRMSYHGRPVEYRMRLALANIGPLRIELIQPLEGDTVYADLKMTMDGAGFGKDGDGHYAYLDTEAALGTTIELIERPKGRMPPEKVLLRDTGPGNASPVA
jgi:methylmalonyl-CoA/ethylmalonyl-CoA epimerase